MAMHRRRTVNQERWQVDGLLTEQEGQLLICSEDEPVGAVQWHGVQYGPNRGSIALNLGIALVPSARGRGIGTIAQRLLADYLFAQTLTQRSRPRPMSPTWPSNAPWRRPAFSAKASCAAPSTAAASGTTW